jgi:hypothetical protein
MMDIIGIIIVGIDDIDMILDISKNIIREKRGFARPSLLSISHPARACGGLSIFMHLYYRPCRKPTVCTAHPLRPRAGAVYRYLCI